MKHISVLQHEIVQFSPENIKSVLDCTLGGGGHSLALLQTYPNLSLVGIDRDDFAVRMAKEKLIDYLPQCHFFHTKFSKLMSHLPNI